MWMPKPQPKYKHFAKVESYLAEEKEELAEEAALKAERNHFIQCKS